jgi:hypothetical protein
LEYVIIFLLFQGLTVKSFPWVPGDNFNLEFLTTFELLRLWRLLEMEEMIFMLYFENIGIRSEILCLNMKFH